MKVWATFSPDMRNECLLPSILEKTCKVSKGILLLIFFPNKISHSHTRIAS